MDSASPFRLTCNGLEPVACQYLGIVSALGRSDLVSAKLTPAIPGPIGSATYADVVLVPRSSAHSLLAAGPWQVPVYVCSEQVGQSGAPQLQVVAWGTLERLDGPQE
jgi:hypothetical protein